MRTRWISEISQWIGLFVVTFLLGKLGLRLATINHNASPVWPLTGFAIFGLIALGSRFWPVLFLGTFLLNILIPSPWPVAAAISLGGTLEALLGRRIYFAVLKKRAIFSYQTRSLAVISSSFIAPLISATIGVGALFVFGVVDVSKAFTAGLTWYGGDLIGALLVLPFLLEVRSRWKARRHLNHREITAVIAGALVFSLALLSSTLTAALFIGFPICLFTLLYAGDLATLTFVAFTGLACSVAAWFGQGPFIHGSLNINLLYHILFLCGISVTAITLIAFQRAKILRANARVLLGFWVLSALLVFCVELYARGLDESHLNLLVTDAKNQMKLRMRSYERGLQGGVAFLQASDGVTRDEWRRFATEFDLVTNLPGSLGFGYAEYVPSGSLADFVRRVREDGAPDFHIRTTSPVGPSVGTPVGTSGGPDDGLIVVKYVEPAERNAQAIGLNISAHPERRATAEWARDTGKAALTPDLVLVQDQKQSPGFVLFAPVYHRNLGPGTIDKRREALIGWTFVPFLLEDFLKASLGNLERELDIEVYGSGRGGGEALIYSSHQRHGSPHLTRVRQSGRSDTIELAQRRLSLVFYPGPAFPYSRDQTTAWTGALCTLLGLVIVSALVNLQISNRRIQEQVQAKTQELLRAQEIAESHRMKSVEAARLASLGEMAGGIAHEINNPLAIIVARSERFRKRVEESSDIPKAEVETFLNHIEQTMMRIAKIVRGMRTLARDGSRPDYHEVPIRLLIEDSLDVCREKFKSRGIRLEVEASESDLVECQPVQIAQVLVNLLNNAEHAIERGATPWIRITAGIVGARARIEVADSGERIEPQVAARMMEPFFTTKDVGKGTGLGLSIARSIMESHRGTLEYLPDRAHTTFVLTFPVRREP